MADGRRRWCGWQVPWSAVWPLLGVCVALPVAAKQQVHCEVRYASQTWQLDAQATERPYEVPAIDIGQRFRFKAVVRGAEPITHIALYTYDMEADGAPALVHEQRLSAPFAAGAQVPALTGWNHVYASMLGRELVYGCALREVTP